MTKSKKITHLKSINPTKDQITDQLNGVFKPNKPVVIKIHFGEPGNHTAFTPEIVAPFVEALESLGHDTTLWDCPVFYSSPRDTKAGYEKVVKDKGFDRLTKCEICDNYVPVELHDGKTAEIAKILASAENLLVLTHVKGHAMAGFGGAIKNIGIGAMSPKTKGLVHEMDSPDDAWGFSQDRLGEVVAAALSKMPEHTYYINVIRNVTKHCDCSDAPDNPIVSPDQGILFGDDIVAIDQASLDLVNSASPDIFTNATGIDPQAHINSTAKYRKN